MHIFQTGYQTNKQNGNIILTFLLIPGDKKDSCRGENQSVSCADLIRAEEYRFEFQEFYHAIFDARHVKAQTQCPLPNNRLALQNFAKVSLTVNSIYYGVRLPKEARTGYLDFNLLAGYDSLPLDTLEKMISTYQSMFRMQLENVDRLAGHGELTILFMSLKALTERPIPNARGGWSLLLQALISIILQEIKYTQAFASKSSNTLMWSDQPPFCPAAHHNIQPSPRVFTSPTEMEQGQASPHCRKEMALLPSPSTKLSCADSCLSQKRSSEKPSPEVR